ncbi:MAG: hypothetical protein AAF292_14150, partial [Pseudomonadota bacterium]
PNPPAGLSIVNNALQGSVDTPNNYTLRVIASDGADSAPVTFTLSVEDVGSSDPTDPPANGPLAPEPSPPPTPFTTVRNAPEGSVMYQYDALGRLQLANYPDEGSINYGYDENGNRQFVTLGESVIILAPAEIQFTPDVTEVSEGETLTITANRTGGDQTVPLNINLSSNDTTELSLPQSTITIPADQTSSTFQVVAIDDGEFDGNKVVTITGRASDSIAEATISVIDTDTPTVDLILAAQSNSVLEGTSVDFSIIRSGVFAEPTIVSLSSSDTSELTVPATATIPAGGEFLGVTPVSVTANGVADGVFDPDRAVTVTASVNGSEEGTLIFTVQNVDPAPSITLTSLPRQVFTEQIDGFIDVLSSVTTCDGGQQPFISQIDGQFASLSTDGQSIRFNTPSFVDPVGDSRPDSLLNDYPITYTIDANGCSPAEGTVIATVREFSPPPQINLSLSATENVLNEGETSTLTVARLNGNQTQPLTIDLSSSDTTELQLSSDQLVIPSNASSETISITAPLDSVVDGNQRPTITATAPGANSQSITFDVIDLDLPPSTLTLSTDSNSIREDGQTSLTITRSGGDLNAPLFVTLNPQTSDELEFDDTTPTIFANQTFRTITVRGKTDNTLDGDQTVTITATAPNSNTASANLVVEDIDEPQNVPPVANQDFIVGQAGQNFQIQPAENDSDANDGNAAIRITGIALPNRQFSDTQLTSFVSFFLSSDGRTIDVEPRNTAGGQTLDLTYRITDQRGAFDEGTISFIFEQPPGGGGGEGDVGRN